MDVITVRPPSLLDGCAFPLRDGHHRMVHETSGDRRPRRSFLLICGLKSTGAHARRLEQALPSRLNMAGRITIVPCHAPVATAARVHRETTNGRDTEIGTKRDIARRAGTAAAAVAVAAAAAATTTVAEALDEESDADQPTTILRHRAKMSCWMEFRWT
jgi:hypothetical protein